MMEHMKQKFLEAAPAADFWSFRLVDERMEIIQVRQDGLQPVTSVRDVGAMATVLHRGGMGYAATSDLSVSGLRAAGERALAWAERTRLATVVDLVMS